MVGWSFIIPAGVGLAALGMVLWYRSGGDPEIARGRAAIVALILAPFIAVGSIGSRWGFDPAEGGPAGGIPVVGALHETFWIWVVSVVAIFAMHELAVGFLNRGDRDEDH
jgi:hypothetical protein